MRADCIYMILMTLLELTLKLSFALFVITGAKSVSITEIIKILTNSSASVKALFLCLNLLKVRKNIGVIFKLSPRILILVMLN